MSDWMEMLRAQVDAKGQAQVARELGYTPSTVSQILSGKYGADTAKVGDRVMAIYGKEGRVECPVLGDIEPMTCLENHKLAAAVGSRTGNPDTARLYRACRSCEVRK